MLQQRPFGRVEIGLGGLVHLAFCLSLRRHNWIGYCFYSPRSIHHMLPLCRCGDLAGTGDSVFTLITSSSAAEECAANFIGQCGRLRYQKMSKFSCGLLTRINFILVRSWLGKDLSLKQHLISSSDALLRNPCGLLSLYA